MSFLPKDYEVPETASNYMKLKAGEHLFRVLSPAIVGYEYWTTENKPIRLKEYPESVPENIKPKSRINHFWAFKVWNYKTESIQILQIIQSTIQDAIKNLHDDPDWGNPSGYDIKITREGESFNDTKYFVVAKPHKELDVKVKEADENTPVDLNLLFKGEDPFGGMKDTEAPQNINSDDVAF